MTMNRKSHDKNLPVWFDGQSINEALFCEEFLQQRKIIFANRAFFMPDGRVTDELMLRGEIYERLKSCVVNNIPRKISNIMEVLKLEAQVDDFPPEQGKIHLDNGTLFLDGTFLEGRQEIVHSRLPVSYNPDASISSKDFYKIYLLWCEENSLTPLKARSFSDAMVTNAKKFHLEHTNKIINSAGRRVWGFTGVESVFKPDNNGFYDASQCTYVPEEWRD